MAGVIEYPPILTNNAQQDNYNLREYIIRNINLLQQVLLDNGGSMHIDENNTTGDINITINAEIEARPNLQEKTVTVNENGDFSVEADENKDGLSKVNLHVAVPEGTAYGTINISENGTHDVTDYATAEVDVQPNLQNKSVTITSNGSQTVTPSTGKDGLSSVAITVNVPTEANLQSKSVSPASADQEVTPDTGFTGLSKVTVAGAPLQTRTVTPTAAGLQVEKSSSSYYGLQRVNVNGDNNLIPGNIRNGVSIFGVAGNYNPSFQLQSKNVTPSAAAQTIVPDSGYDGLSQVVVAAAPLQAKSVTPSASQQEITPASGYVGLSKVTVAGDADLIASNIKKDVNIFGVIGTYEPGAITGSLIEITCSSNIDEVTATVNGHTYTARLNTSTHIAYVTIPYTDTIAAQTCVLNGYNSGSQVTSSYVSMAIGIGYYTADLSTSDYLFDYGTYYGISDTSWTVVGPGRGTVTNGVNSIHIECNNGNYSHTFKLNSLVDTRGYQNFEITYVIVSGSISGGGSDWAPGNSNVRFANQQGMRTFINFPSSSGEVSIQTRASTNGQYAMSDAELQFTFSCPMGGVPFVIDIYSIKFV